MSNTLSLATICVLFLFIVPDTALAVDIDFAHHFIASSYSDDSRQIRAVDMDQDGDMDLVTGSVYFATGELSWWENDGNQNFTEIKIAHDSDNFWYVEVGDMDVDGDIDIVTARDDEYVNCRLTVWENDGNQGFTPLDILNNGNSVFHSLGVEDIDNDQDLDIVSTKGASTVFWMERTTGLSFVYHDIDTQCNNLGYATYPSDVNSDGYMDIAGCEMGAFQTVWWENDGNQVFTKRVMASFSGEPGRVVAEDVDNDGDTDAVVTLYTDEMYVLENDGAQGFTKHLIENGFPSIQEITVGDIDLDDDLDIVAAGYWTNEMRWYQNDGGLTFTTHVLPGGGSMSPRIVDDLDGDGDPDLIAASWVGQTYSWWESDCLMTLEISPDPLIAGSNGHFAVSNGEPYTMTYLAYSLNGERNTYVPYLDVWLGLANPAQGGPSKFTDGNGQVAWDLSIPLVVQGFEVWLQAAQHGKVSRVIHTSVQ